MIFESLKFKQACDNNNIKSFDEFISDLTKYIPSVFYHIDGEYSYQSNDCVYNIFSYGWTYIFYKVDDVMQFDVNKLD